MNERAFLEQAIEELEQTREEMDYWKQKYEDLRKETQSLIDWIKENIKTGEKNGKNKCSIQNS